MYHSLLDTTEVSLYGHMLQCCCHRSLIVCTYHKSHATVLVIVYIYVYTGYKSYAHMHWYTYLHGEITDLCNTSHNLHSNIHSRMHMCTGHNSSEIGICTYNTVHNHNIACTSLLRRTYLQESISNLQFLVEKIQI